MSMQRTHIMIEKIALTQLKQAVVFIKTNYRQTHEKEFNTITTPFDQSKISSTINVLPITSCFPQGSTLGSPYISLYNCIQTRWKCFILVVYNIGTLVDPKDMTS